MLLLTVAFPDHSTKDLVGPGTSLWLPKEVISGRLLLVEMPSNGFLGIGRSAGTSLYYSVLTLASIHTMLLAGRWNCRIISSLYGSFSKLFPASGGSSSATKTVWFGKVLTAFG